VREIFRVSLCKIIDASMIFEALRLVKLLHWLKFQGAMDAVAIIICLSFSD
jgi:hypothetical protein